MFALSYALLHSQHCTETPNTAHLVFLCPPAARPTCSKTPASMKTVVNRILQQLLVEPTPIDHHSPPARSTAPSRTTPQRAAPAAHQLLNARVSVLDSWRWLRLADPHSRKVATCVGLEDADVLVSKLHPVIALQVQRHAPNLHTRPSLTCSLCWLAEPQLKRSKRSLPSHASSFNWATEHL